MDKDAAEEIGHDEFNLDFDFGDDFLLNPYRHCITDTFFDQHKPLSTEEVGLNQTESNSNFSTNVASSFSPSKPQQFSSFLGSDNELQHLNNILNCPELETSPAKDQLLPTQATPDQNTSIAFAANSPNFATTFQNTNMSRLMSAMTRNQLMNNPHMHQSLFDTSVPTIGQHPQTTLHILSNTQKACNTSITLDQAVSPNQQINSGYSFNQQSSFDGNVPQTRQILQTQYGLGRLNPNQQNVLPANLQQPHQLHQARQVNVLNQSAVSNQLLRYHSNNSFNNLRRANQYSNFFARNLIGGSGSRQSSLFSNLGQGGSVLKNNYRIDQNGSALGFFDSRLQELSGWLNNQRAQSDHQVPTRPSVLHPQYLRPRTPQLSNAFMPPPQLPVAQNMLQPQLPPVSFRPDQLLDHPQPLQQQNLTPNDPPMLTRARGLVEDQQLFDVPILAHDSEEANTLLPGSSFMPSWPQTIEVGTPKLNDTSVVPNSTQSVPVILQSWQQENGGDVLTGSLLADQLRAQLNAHKEKEMERRRKSAEQLLASAEPFGTATETYWNKRARIDQCGNAAPSYTTPEEIKLQNSSLPPKRRGGQVRRGNKEAGGRGCR